MRKIDYHHISKSPEPSHIPTKEKVAIKILEKSRIEDASDSERIYREIKFLKKLNHVNIIRTFEVYLYN